MQLPYNRQGSNIYKQNSVQTTSRVKLVLMLYDGALKFLELAKRGIEKKDMTLKSLYLGKAEKIINELSLSLNFEKGGEIAKNLERLYGFALWQLTEANIENNAARIVPVIRILSILREGWLAIEGKEKDIQTSEKAHSAHEENKKPYLAAHAAY